MVFGGQGACPSSACRHLLPACGEKGEVGKRARSGSKGRKLHQRPLSPQGGERVRVRGERPAHLGVSRQAARRTWTLRSPAPRRLNEAMAPAPTPPLPASGERVRARGERRLGSGCGIGHETRLKHFSAHENWRNPTGAPVPRRSARAYRHAGARKAHWPRCHARPRGHAASPRPRRRFAPQRAGHG